MKRISLIKLINNKKININYLPLPLPPRLKAPRPRPGTLPFGGGDFGLSASILSVQPVVI